MTTEQDIKERLKSLSRQAERLFREPADRPPLKPAMTRQKAAQRTQAFDWQFEERCRETTEMLQAARNACGLALMGDAPPILSLVGNTGTGKTHLAKRIRAFWGQHMAWRSVPGIGIPAAREMRMLKWATLQDADLAERRRRLAIARTADLLIIDDIGAEHGEKMTQWAAQQILSLLESRQELATVITSNMTMAELTEWDARIADRMRRPGCLLVEVTEAGSYSEHDGKDHTSP